MNAQRDDVAKLLRGFEVSSGDLDDATSERLRGRLDAIMGEVDTDLHVATPRPVTPVIEAPPPPRSLAVAPGPELLPAYERAARPRRSRTSLALVAAAAVAATVLALAILPEGPSHPPGHEIAASVVIDSVRSSPDLGPTAETPATFLTTVRRQGGQDGTIFETSRRREVDVTGSVTDTFASTGRVTTTIQQTPITEPLFGPFTYAELRALPSDPASLEQLLTQETLGYGTAATLAEMAAWPVTPPEVRAAAIELLTSEGFTWRLDDDGLMIGSRDSEPTEQLLLDPATGRVMAYGWVEDPQDPLLDAVRVTTWR